MRFKQTGDIRLECSLDLKLLFREPKQRRLFDQKWPEFLASHVNNREVYSLRGDTLHYSSEELVPKKLNKKPALLMVFGNPAPQSIKSGMFFSYERDKKEHRFWKDILRAAQISTLSSDPGSSIEELNASRKQQILNLTYSPDYRVGLCVFITMPSAAGGSWGGVAGIRKLLGGEAFERIEKEESLRVIDCAKRFVGQKGRVVIFQKNAWECLRSDGDPGYSVERAKGCNLKGTLRGANHIPIFGVPPTRLSGPCREAITGFFPKAKSCHS